MAYLDEVATMIEAGTTEAGTGSAYPIFRGHLPDSTVLGDRAVALIMSAGAGDEARIEIDNPGLQVVVRGAPINQVSTGYEEAEAVAWATKNALHEYTGTPESTGLYYVGVWSESGPFFIGFDESMRPMFSSNMRVLRSRT